MKYILVVLVVLINFWGYNQEDVDSDIKYHYMLNACNDIQFFEDVYNSIDGLERVFVSTCFYYLELLKQEKVSVDTFDMLTPSNYYLLKVMLSKNTDLYGYSKSSYIGTYFKLNSDSTVIYEMNEILDSVSFKNSDFATYLKSNDFKRLNLQVEKKDSVLIDSLLNYLHLENNTLIDINRYNILGINNIFSNQGGKDLIVDFFFYDLATIYSGRFHRNELSLWFKPDRKTRYHIAINRCDGVKNKKVKRIIRKGFNLRRRDLKCGNIVELANGDEVKLYCY